MSSAATATTKPTESVPAEKGAAQWPILVPYLVAIGAQFPMLYLYYRKITAQPHYQPVLIAVIAVVGIALMRWPFNRAKPFHQSLTSDILMIVGLGAAIFGTVFVEPWFCAFATMLMVTSLFARTLDKESLGSLWTGSLPLYVYLALPMGMDVSLITTLQRYSAVYTSRLLDLAGLGHHMDGTVINVPSLREYGIEEACSGVQSFFTLLLVAVVFIVLSRRIRAPQIGVSILSIMMAFVLLIAQLFPFATGVTSQVLLFASVGFALYAFLGFRAAALILSAVFWAVFMNTIRILTIPLAEYFFKLPLAEGIGHTILGYIALGAGIAMVLSTDQFLMFLFGPVEETSETGPFGRMLNRMWNSLSKTKDDDEDTTSSRRRRRSERVSISDSNQKFLWVAMGLMVLAGIWQIVDVQRSIARADKGVRFFDSDMTVEFEQNDLPERINDWKRDKYVMQNRTRGSDLGERSDMWQYRSPSGIKVVASLDQTFPGWHELTTCYKNTGWRMISRKVLTPSSIRSDSEDAASTDVTPEGDEWGLIEATFEKTTGERGYLLFSHFDSFGEGLDVPADWGTFTSLFTRAANRLSHRIRASLLRGEAYQFQIFMTSTDEVGPEIKSELRQKYLLIRDQVRQRFLEKLDTETE
ncbi:MAG: exosortase U [Planctomycetota bacterium]